jgi:hypothetical protein
MSATVVGWIFIVVSVILLIWATFDSAYSSAKATAAKYISSYALLGVGMGILFKQPW